MLEDQQRQENATEGLGLEQENWGFGWKSRPKLWPLGGAKDPKTNPLCTEHPAKNVSQIISDIAEEEQLEDADTF